MAAATVKWNLKPLEKLVKQLQNGDSKHIRAAYKQWGKRYETYVRRAFIKNSKGGGLWPDLAESTKAGRRNKNKATIAILRDTGTLLNALSIGGSGNETKELRNGLRFGFGGPSRHPNGKATIADIATWHNSGRRRLPRRQILIQPDAQLVTSMLNDLKRGIDRAGRENKT